MSTAFRFVHASDFHLEQPPHGLVEVPEHLRELLLDAPYRAAERVFDVAIAAEADFVVLAGDVLDAELTGPRGPVFLAGQFERLQQQGIAVYWAGSEVDAPDCWPDYVELPGNVRRFGTAAIEGLCFGHGGLARQGATKPIQESIHRRDGVALARVLGVSREAGRAIPSEGLCRDNTGLFTLAVAYGEDVAAVAGRDLDYWALGGRHHENTLSAESAGVVGSLRDPSSGHGVTGPHSWMAHFPGSPQGRCPAETGPHGCTLVTIDERGRIHDRQIPTDVIRWRQEAVDLEETTSHEQLQDICRQRLERLLETEADVTHLIAWRLRGHGPLAAALRHEEASEELLDHLRTEFGYHAPAAWSVSLHVDPEEALPPVSDDESFLAEFLDTVRHYQEHPADPLQLEPYLGQHAIVGYAARVPKDVLAREPRTLLDADQQSELLHVRQREQVLTRVAQLGIELLGHGE